ncbi:tyrosine-type recombinase/integrase [Kribbella caucasensis]|uniref:tyrosine-type recombinase/integrase n=1 Tax=Kribbella caucasensis TaxID=2512215 RepID=UPI00105E171F
MSRRVSTVDDEFCCLRPAPCWNVRAKPTGGGPSSPRPHDVRHTAATLVLEQGVDIRVVQEILGHSSLAVTMRYTHVTSKLARGSR